MTVTDRIVGPSACNVERLKASIGMIGVASNIRSLKKPCLREFVICANFLTTPSSSEGTGLTDPQSTKGFARNRYNSSRRVPISKKNPPELIRVGIFYDPLKPSHS